MRHGASEFDENARAFLLLAGGISGVLLVLIALVIHGGPVSASAASGFAWVALTLVLGVMYLVAGFFGGLLVGLVLSGVVYLLAALWDNVAG